MKQQATLIGAVLLFFVACIQGAVGEPTKGEPVKEDRKKLPFQVDYGDCTFRWESKLKLDAAGTTNANRLNNKNCDLDKTVIPGRFVYDGMLLHFFHNPKCGWDTARIKTGLRWRGIFGAPESSFRTGPMTIKDTDVVLGSHVHPLTIHVPIIREIWGEFVLNELLGLSFSNVHTFTMGLFPFYLGRGIALGDSYAVAPDFIGYDPATSVDQFAPGFKISGSLCANHWLDYDLYAAITDNFSDSFNNVNLKTQGQFYGHRFDQARGFGIINYILAGRLQWKPIERPGERLYVEPYILFNDERNQKVEVSGDASSSLGTVGLAIEIVRGDLEFGFDTAHNFGTQHVKGLDRNVLAKELRTLPSISAGGNCMPSGDQVAVVVENSHVVLVSDGKTKVPFNPCSSPGLQSAIDAPIARSACDSDLEQFNGKVLNVPLKDTASNQELQVMNAKDRFRDPYTNRFTGSMFVADMTYRIRTNFKIAAMVGYATGDDDPNEDINELNDSSEDGDYKGFIGLQEVYSGNRVRSAFVLGGAGKIPRITSYPVNKQANPNVDAPTNQFPTTLSRFSNIALIGGALWWNTEECARKWVINPNIITYWQPHAPRIFNRTTGKNVIETRADHHLGTEFNVFVDNVVAPGLRLFFVGGFFIPGKYYDDLKGRPISKAEQKYLDSLDGTGEPSDRTPVLGNDPGFFVNLGIEYKF